VQLFAGGPPHGEVSPRGGFGSFCYRRSWDDERLD
jgi:hypothetical protein